MNDSKQPRQFQSLNDVQLLDCIGWGGFGCSRLVRNKRDQHLYVLREFDVDLIVSRVRGISRKKISRIVADGQREFVLLRAAKEKPDTLLVIYGIFQGSSVVDINKKAHSMFYVALENWPGLNLRRLIATRRREARPFEEFAIKNWSYQLAGAILYLHESNFLARDIRPSNVRLSPDLNRVKLCYASLARYVELSTPKRLNESIRQIDSEFYTAPEFWNYAGQFTPKCDIFALGVTLYEAVNFRKPFDSVEDTRTGLFSESFIGGYSGDCESFILGMLKTNPDVRFSINRVVNHSFLNFKPPPFTPSIQQMLPFSSALDESLDISVITSSKRIPENMKEPICEKLRAKIVTTRQLLYQMSEPEVDKLLDSPRLTLAIRSVRNAIFDIWKTVELPDDYSRLAMFARNGQIGAMKSILTSPDLPYGGLAVLLSEKSKDNLPETDHVLNIACYFGQIDAVRYLIEDLSCSLEQPNSIPPILRACQGDSCQPIVIDYLMEIQKEKEESVELGQSNPINWAAQYGRLEIVQHLIRKLPHELEKRGFLNRTPLLCAAVGARLNNLKFLTEICDVNLEAVDSSGATPLHLACMTGDLKTVEYLFETRPQWLSINDYNGRPPLLVAASVGQLIIVKYLLEIAKANPNAVDSKGYSTLTIATYYGFLDIVKYLMVNHPDMQKLETAEHENVRDVAIRRCRTTILDWMQELDIYGDLQDTY